MEKSPEQKKTKEKNWKCNATLNVFIALSVSVAVSFGLLKWAMKQKQKKDVLNKQIEVLQNTIDSTVNALPYTQKSADDLAKQIKMLQNERDSLLTKREKIR